MPSITNISVLWCKVVTKMTMETLINVNSITVLKLKKTHGEMRTVQLISQICAVISSHVNLHNVVTTTVLDWWSISKIFGPLSTPTVINLSTIWMKSLKLNLITFSKIVTETLIIWFVKSNFGNVSLIMKTSIDPKPVNGHMNHFSVKLHSKTVHSVLVLELVMILLMKPWNGTHN